MNSEPTALLATLPHPSTQILSVLETDGPLVMDDLAQACQINQPGVSKILRTLQEEELVFRIAVTDDVRSWLIALAPRGAAALTGARADAV